MSSRYGRYVAALGGLILALAVGGQAVGQPDSKREAQGAQTVPKPATAAPVQPPITARPRPKYCDGAKPSEDDSLCYERRSAQAAEEQGLWAKRGFWLGVAQAIGLVVTVAFTFMGLRLAKRALMNVERAWMFVATYNAQTLGDKVLIQPEWKNGGSTPATRAVYRAAWAPFPAPLTKAYDFPDLGEDGKPTSKFAGCVGAMIGPGASTHAQGISIPTAQIDELIAERCHIYLWGWIEYDDVLLGPRHRTEFAVKILALRATIRGDETEVAMSFATHWQHNGADDSCMKKPDPYPGNPERFQ